MQDRTLTSSPSALRRLLLASIAASAIAAVFPNNAIAGFQWVAPAESVAPSRQAAPQVAVGNAYSPSPAPRSPVQVQNYVVSPSPRAIAPVVVGGDPEPLVSSSGRSSDGDGAVRGFADSVPLAVAMRQVLPPDHGFSVDPDVGSDVMVSWRGGKSWRQTIKDMIQPAGLSMREREGLVIISRSGASGSSVIADRPASLLQSPSNTVLDRPSSLGTLGGDDSFDQAPVSIPTVAANGGFAGTRHVGAAPTVLDTWTANRGETLRSVLDGWARKAGVEVSWQAEYDYPIQASVASTGTFEEAVRGLLLGFQDAQPQPIARLHNSPTAGQTVLVVEVRGNNYSD